MKFAFIDDEERELLKLLEFTKEYESENGVSLEAVCFKSGEEFLREFLAFSYNVIFIDIYMDKLTGIETANQIRKLDTHAIIVFITSSMEHMLDAFSCHAFDYIEKPITKDRFNKVLGDVFSVFPKAESTFSFTYNGVDICMPFSDFVYLMTSGHNTEIVNIKGEHYSPYITYKSVSEKLKLDPRFLQINKCILVNMDYIVKFEGKNCLMTNNVFLPVNIRNVKTIEQTWRNYIFMKLHGKLEGDTNTND